MGIGQCLSGLVLDISLLALKNFVPSPNPYSISCLSFINRGIENQTCSVFKIFSSTWTDV